MPTHTSNPNIPAYLQLSTQFYFYPSNRVFWIYWKNWHYVFLEFVMWWKIILFAIFQHKSHFWEKSSPWEMGKNALGQSDCRIFKSTMYTEQNDQINWCSACQCKFKKNKSWLKSFLCSCSKTGYDQSGHRTLKIGCMSKINRLNKLIFCKLIQIQES